MLFRGNTFILPITNEIDKKAIIRKDKNTIPKDLKFDLRFKINNSEELVMRHGECEVDYDVKVNNIFFKIT